MGMECKLNCRRAARCRCDMLQRGMSALLGTGLMVQVESLGKWVDGHFVCLSRK